MAQLGGALDEILQRLQQHDCPDEAPAHHHNLTHMMVGTAEEMKETGKQVKVATLATDCVYTLIEDPETKRRPADADHTYEILVSGTMPALRAYIVTLKGLVGAH